MPIMDDSQSSDIFSQTGNNLEDSSTFKIETYKLLVKKIKAFASESIRSHPMYSGHQPSQDITLQEGFIELIDDCRSCIHQILEIITSLLEAASIQIDKLCDYLEDAVHILQILSNFIKTNNESVIITCHTVKNFSTCTANIILSIFTHCKDSECIYGNSLCAVEKQLKDLFRNCHELQLTYLMTLEKHFKFDLTEKEDQDILVKTLEINLKIGDVVQSLDVKTMAEQWKAYTIICEKYSSFLLTKNIFNTSSKLLASTIECHIKTAFEANEEDKIVLRSLKVANFSLKILFRLCDIFKCSENNDFKYLVKLLIHVCLCNSSYYEVMAKISAGFSLVISTHLLVPSETIIGSLVCEDNFLKIIFTTEIGDLKDNQLLGYTLLVISIMKAILKKKDTPNDNKDRIFACVFALLPYCHKWFNIGLKFKYTTEDKTRCYGLYEHLLLYSVALAKTMHLEQYNNLEKYLYETLLGTECYSAFFASNLWVLLCRLGNNQLPLDVLVGLIKVYQKLETHCLFTVSPQRVHLSYTIEKLFQTLDDDDKLQVSRQFNVKDLKNIEVWSVLKIRHLRDDVQKSVNRSISDNLVASFNEVWNDTEDSFDSLIKYMKLASTCSFVERDSRIEDILLRAWRRACPVCNNVIRMDLNNQSLSFRYLEGLASLTDCYLEKFEQRTSLIQIFHTISNFLLIENNETLHLLFKLFCKLSNSLVENQNDASILTVLTNTVKKLLKKSDDIQQYIFRVTITDEDISKLVKSILEQSIDGNNFIKFINKFSNIKEWQKQLDSASEFKYIHKCMINIDHNLTKKNENNFDLGDIDSMFEESGGEEPASKKMKFDVNVENILGKLETDIQQLCNVKENVLSEEYKYRIKSLCDKLNNIIS